MQGGQALIDAETAFEEFKPKIVELRKQYDEALAEEESSRYNNESFQNFISAVAFLPKEYDRNYVLAETEYKAFNKQSPLYSEIQSHREKSRRIAFFDNFSSSLWRILDKYFFIEQSIAVGDQQEDVLIITPEGKRFIEKVIQELKKNGFPEVPHEYTPQELLNFTVKSISAEIRAIKKEYDEIVSKGGLQAYKVKEAAQHAIPYVKLIFASLTPDFWKEEYAWRNNSGPMPEVYQKQKEHSPIYNFGPLYHLTGKLEALRAGIYLQPPLTKRVQKEGYEEIFLTPEGEQFAERVISLLKEAGFPEEPTVTEKNKKELADLIFVDFKENFGHYKQALQEYQFGLYPIIEKVDKYLLIPTIKLELQHYSDRATQEEIVKYYHNKQLGKKPDAIVQKENIEFDYDSLTQGLVHNLITKLNTLLFTKDTVNVNNSKIPIYYGQASEIENLTKQIIELLKSEGFSDKDMTLSEVVEKVVTPEIEKEVAVFIAAYQKDATTLTSEQKNALHAVIEYFAWFNNANQEHYTEQEFKDASAIEEKFFKTVSSYQKAEQFVQKVADLIRVFYTTRETIQTAEHSVDYYRKLRPQGHLLLEKIIAQLKAAGIE